jgi:hypothetical protein
MRKGTKKGVRKSYYVKKGRKGKSAKVTEDSTMKALWAARFKQLGIA